MMNFSIFTSFIFYIIIQSQIRTVIRRWHITVSVFNNINTCIIWREKTWFVYNMNVCMVWQYSFFYVIQLLDKMNESIQWASDHSVQTIPESHSFPFRQTDHTQFIWNIKHLINRFSGIWIDHRWPDGLPAFLFSCLTIRISSSCKGNKYRCHTISGHTFTMALGKIQWFISIFQEILQIITVEHAWPKEKIKMSMSNNIYYSKGFKSPLSGSLVYWARFLVFLDGT